MELQTIDFSDGNQMMVPLYILGTIAALKADSKDVEAFFNKTMKIEDRSDNTVEFNESFLSEEFKSYYLSNRHKKLFHSQDQQLKDAIHTALK